MPGVLVEDDLLAIRCVDENIKKVRRSFFHYGRLGMLQGDLSPLSTRFVIETCATSVTVWV